MSDAARSFFIDRMTALAAEIGHEAFERVIVRVIDTCERRPTIGTMRRLAGLCVDTPIPAAAAWNTVTTILQRHVGRDGNGMAVLTPRTRIVDGVAVTEPVPEITDNLKQAVTSLGGWTALADCEPQWMAERYRAFKELYQPESSTK